MDVNNLEYFHILFKEKKNVEKDSRVFLYIEEENEHGDENNHSDTIISPVSEEFLIQYNIDLI